MSYVKDLFENVLGLASDASKATRATPAPATPASDADALPFNERQLSLIDKMLQAQSESIAASFESALVRFLDERATPAPATPSSDSELTPLRDVSLASHMEDDEPTLSALQKATLEIYAKRQATFLCWHLGLPVIFYKTQKSKTPFRQSIAIDGKCKKIARDELIAAGSLDASANDSLENAPILLSLEDALANVATPATPATPAPDVSKAKRLATVSPEMKQVGHGQKVPLRTLQGAPPKIARFTCKRSSKRAEKYNVGMAYRVQFENTQNEIVWSDGTAASAITPFALEYLTSNIVPAYSGDINYDPVKGMLWLYFGNVDERETTFAHQSSLDKAIKAIASALNTTYNRNA